QRLLALDPAGAIATGAGLGNHLARAATGRAGLLDAEETLLHAYLAVAAAGAASLRRGARLGAGAMTGVALIPRGHANGGIETLGRLLQRDFQVVAQVGAAIDLRPAPPSSPGSRAKDIAKNVAKGVGESA